MRSLSEIDTVSKRASRATGFEWGVAEEVGKNIRILEMLGIPGIKNLPLRLLGNIHFYQPHCFAL